MKLWRDGRRSRSGVNEGSRSGACSLPRKYDSLIIYPAAVLAIILLQCESSFPNNGLNNYNDLLCVC